MREIKLMDNYTAAPTDFLLSAKNLNVGAPMIRFSKRDRGLT